MSSSDHQCQGSFVSFQGGKSPKPTNLYHSTLDKTKGPADPLLPSLAWLQYSRPAEKSRKTPLRIQKMKGKTLEANKFRFMHASKRDPSAHTHTHTHTPSVLQSCLPIFCSLLQLTNLLTFPTMAVSSGSLNHWNRSDSSI